MSHYCKSRLGEYFFSLCVAVSLIYVIASGFLMDDVWSGKLSAILPLSALVLLLCYLAAYRRWMTGGAVVVGVILAAAVVIYCQQNHPLADETANSTFLYLLITLLVTVLVYLLGRSRWGTVALFLVGTLIAAGAHFLQFPAPLWSVVVIPTGVIGIFLCRVYLVGLKQALLGREAHWKTWVQSGLLCLLTLALAGGIYGGIIAPLDPPTQELKLISVLRSMESLQVLGVSTTRTVLDTELTSTASPELSQSTDQTQEEEDEEPKETEVPDNGSDLASDDQQEESSEETDLSAVSYDTKTLNLWWLWLLLIPALLAGGCGGLMARRKAWHRKQQTLPPEEALMNYYLFFLSKLRRLEFRRPEGQTLRIFVRENQHRLAHYQVDDVTFQWLTEQYERVFYGGQPVTPETLEKCEAFYQHFYPALRQEVGSVGYYLRGFWL
jgi:hypothetical protein